MRTSASIQNFFYPESILLIGASSKPKTIGYEILKSLIDFGFKGKIYVVNPKSDEILGIKCNKSIEEINDNISLAIILLPKHLVFDSLKSCSLKQIKNVVIITAGFREVGEEGSKLEREITQFVKENDIRLVGPNCMGLINTDENIKLNATFAAQTPLYSPISFLSQSGALAAAVLNTIRETGYTFGQFISIGNKADVNENDLLEFWWKDSKTKVITMYLESFENGRKFFNLARNVTQDKPVIILKAAKTKSGASAASSHTGALATQDDIVEAALKQSGCIRVKTIEEMFETAKAILKFGYLKNNRIAILTNAGGPAILCTDEIEQNGLSIAYIKEETREQLRKILHPEASLKNPVDMLPSADEFTYRAATKILSEDENVDAIIVIFVEPVMINSFDVIKALAEEQLLNSKPILIVTFPLPHFWEKWKNEGIKNALILKSVEIAPVILSHLYEYHKRKLINEDYELTLNDKTKNKILNILNGVKKKSPGASFLTSRECKSILKALELPVVNSKFLLKEIELKKISNNIKFPCVLKISSRKITHKSDIEGVFLNIPNKKALIKTFNKLKSKLKKKNLIQFIDEFELQEYFEGDIEVIIGAYRDSSFGPLINFGSGGKLVEIIQDKNLALAPISKSRAIELIMNSKAYPLISGFRDIQKADIPKLAELIERISLLISEFDEIKEIDLNPVMIKAQKIKIVDYRISISFT